MLSGFFSNEILVNYCLYFDREHSGSSLWARSVCLYIFIDVRLPLLALFSCCLVMSMVVFGTVMSFYNYLTPKLSQ